MGRKGSEKSVKSYCMGPSEIAPVEEEIPENEFNVATRQINLADALGVCEWGGKEMGRGLF